jgi:dTMP kinase
MQRGFHIVLEGPDAAGKKTQTERLVQRLITEGQPAVRIEFPAYDQPYGRLVRQYLDHQSPSADPAYAAILYAADRREAVPHIQEQLAQGVWVVCDRYTASSLAHQVARVEGADPLKQKELADWILETERSVLSIPEPDLTILLNVDPELCHSAAASRGAVDRHEKDDQHLRMAWEQYQKLAKDGKWPVVQCSEKGALLSREEIHEQIWVVVRSALN